MGNRIKKGERKIILITKVFISSISNKKKRWVKYLEDI